ncbi:hypothetical protein [Salisaeta longa]|uniref:hypothetical protein n=1 Tax=Salisaeta longa TaxID=503170 RepID=UPI0003B6CB2F|nr:hypothetical protein [Salisaeta longa]
MPRFAVLLFLTVCSIGCWPQNESGAPPPIAAGRYQLFVDGARVDTLRGPAYFFTADDRLVRLELGAAGAMGLSVEVDPLPLRRRTYHVIDPALLAVKRPGGRPGMAGFLELTGGHTFTTEAGSLHVAHVSPTTVGGTLDLVLQAPPAPGSGWEGTVHVTGTWRAQRP